MKKNLFILFFGFLSFHLVAQKTKPNFSLVNLKTHSVQSSSIIQTYYYQDFEDSAQAYSSMTFVDKDGHKPHNAGFETWVVTKGQAVSSSWIDNGDKTADDWMITPKITVGSRVYIAWDAIALDASYADGYQVLISTSGTTIPSDFTEIFSIEHEKADWTHHIIGITALAAGKDIYIAFRNNSTDEYFLIVDNIRVYNPNDVDMALDNHNLQHFVVAESEIDLKVQFSNRGVDTLKSLNINWQINAGDIHTANLSDINLPTGQTYDYAFTDKPSFPEGSDSIKIWSDTPNGVTDGDKSNDTLKYTIMALANAGERKVLIEHFTQASCGPCALQNPSFFALIFNNQNQDKLAHIAYHTWWPGTDPMYNFNELDVKKRVSYYNVSGVPHAILAGNQQVGAPGDIGQKQILNESERLGVFNFNLSSQISGSNLHIQANIKAITDIAQTLNIRTVLVEDMYYSSAPGTNGEKDFPNVMRKMFPDATGTQWTDIKKNDSLSLNFDYQIPSEIKIDNCSIIIFAQNDENKEIYGVSKINLGNPSAINDNQNIKVKLYPNPAKDFIFVESPAYIKAIQVFNISGQSIWKQKFTKGINKTYFQVNNLPTGLYTIRLNTSKGTTYRKFMIK